MRCWNGIDAIFAFGIGLRDRDCEGLFHFAHYAVDGGVDAEGFFYGLAVEGEAVEVIVGEVFECAIGFCAEDVALFL